MNEKLITCYFCFETFGVLLEVDAFFSGNVTEIYDCDVCCNPNKLHYMASGGDITIIEVSDGNE